MHFPLAVADNRRAREPQHAIGEQLRCAPLFPMSTEVIKKTPSILSRIPRHGGMHSR